MTLFISNLWSFIWCRFLSFFYDRVKVEDSDDIHAALALMYGYAARYAPSTVIEARIDALLVCIYSDNEYDPSMTYVSCFSSPSFGEFSFML